MPPQFGGFFGRSGSGKSHALWLKYQEWHAAWPRQTLVFSPKEFDAQGKPLDNYHGKIKCKWFRDIHQFVKEARTGRHAVFVPSLDRKTDERDFDLFYRLAMALSPVITIPEELHTVTRPSGGPPAWRIANTIGRGCGLAILGSSQRPAHVDKDFFGGLSYAWCGAQNYEEDAKETAKLVLVTPADILQLPAKTGIERIMEG